MEPEVLVFMPNGDITLTLVRNVYEEDEQQTRSFPPRKKRRLSLLQQTSIDENKKWELEDRELEDVLEDESMLFYAPDAPGASEGPSHPPTPRGGRGSDASSRRDRSTSPPASFWAQLKRQQAARNEIAVEDDEVVPDPETVVNHRKILSTHEVECIVSSKHMMLASRVFEKLLSGDSAEAKMLKIKGHAKIQVLADYETMVILLNVIHGPSRKVPRQVTLDELSNLAQLASKFGMTEAVQFFSDTWIDALERDGFPKTYNRAVLQLLLVFHVFDRPDEFRAMSRLIQRECSENVLEDAKDIPLPSKILDEIRKEREEAIDAAITTVQTLVDRYLDGKAICDASLDDDLQYACDAMILGSLLKSSRKIGIWPKPETPFVGKNFKDLAKAIRGIRIVDVCNRSSRRFANLGSACNGHGLEDEIEASMKRIETGLDGLELLQYAKESDNLDAGLAMFVLSSDSFDDEAKSIGSEETITEPYTSRNLETDLNPSTERSLFAEEEITIEEPATSSMIEPLTVEESKERHISTNHFRVQSPLGGRESTEGSSQAHLSTVLDVHARSENLKSTPVEQPGYPRSFESILEHTSPRVSEFQHSFPSSRTAPSEEWRQSNRATGVPVLESKSSWETDGTRTPTESSRSEETRRNESRSSVDSSESERVKVEENTTASRVLETRPPSETNLVQEHLYFKKTRKQNVEPLLVPFTVPTHGRDVYSEPITSNVSNNKAYAIQRKDQDQRFPQSATSQQQRQQTQHSTSGVPKQREEPPNALSRVPSKANEKTSSVDDRRLSIGSSTSDGLRYQEKRAPNIDNRQAENSNIQFPALEDPPAQPRNQQYSKASATREKSPPLTQSEKLSQAVSQLEAARAYIHMHSTNGPPPQPEPLRRGPRESTTPRRSPPNAAAEQARLAATTNRSLQQANSSPQLHRHSSSSTQAPYISSKLSQSAILDDDESIEDLPQSIRVNGNQLQRESLEGKQRFSYPHAGATTVSNQQQFTQPASSAHNPQMKTANGKVSPVERFHKEGLQKANTQSTPVLLETAKTTYKENPENRLTPNPRSSHPLPDDGRAYNNGTQPQAVPDAPRNDFRTPVLATKDNDNERLSADRQINNKNQAGNIENTYQKRIPPNVPSFSTAEKPPSPQEERKHTLPFRPAPIQEYNTRRSPRNEESQPVLSRLEQNSTSINDVTPAPTQRYQKPPPVPKSNDSNTVQPSTSPTLTTPSQQWSTSYIPNRQYQSQSDSYDRRGPQTQKSQPESVLSSSSWRPIENDPPAPSRTSQNPKQNLTFPPPRNDYQKERASESVRTAESTNERADTGRREDESPEEDESWDQPHKFNMRKSKKKFSLRI